MKNVQKFKKAGFKFWGFLVIVLVTLVLGETALRICNYFVPSFIIYSGSYNRFRGKPFADDWDFKLNSQGFMDEEFTEKKGEQYRIIGLGDSFSFGAVPYKYNYLTLIESGFRGENVDVEVLNMGIPAIGPKGYLSLLVKEGLSLKPDMVLLSFFIGNDFYESRKKRLYEHSYVASLIHYIFTLQRDYEGGNIHWQDEYCDDCPTFKPKRYLKIEYDRSSIYLVENEEFPDMLHDAVTCLKQIRDICRSAGIDLLVILIPDEIQVSEDLLKGVKDAYYPTLEEEKWDSELPNRLLSRELDNLGIAYIDLFNDFSNSPVQLYKPRNTHWNIAGNQKAADIIHGHIRQHLLVRGHNKH